MHKSSTPTVLLFSLILGWSSAPTLGEEATIEDAVDIGSCLELFVDDYLIESMEEVELRLHSPQSAGKVFDFDRPWEGNVSWQLGVFKDGDIYRMYYMGRSDPTYARKAGLKSDETLVPEHPHFLCYAESRDGVHWTKPELGQYEFNGSKKNNIVGKPIGGPPYLDARPGVDASRRYLAPGGVGINPRFGDSSKKGIGLVLHVSPDGLNWKKWREDPLFITTWPNAFDSVNVLFWSECCGAPDHSRKRIATQNPVSRQSTEILPLHFRSMSYECDRRTAVCDRRRKRVSGTPYRRRRTGQDNGSEGSPR